MTAIGERVGGAARRTLARLVPAPVAATEAAAARPTAIYLGGGRVLTDHPVAASFIADGSDLLVTPQVLRGGYEAPVTAFLRATVHPGDAVVEVGANQGFHTVTLAALVGPTGRVLAYEPHPRVHGFLAANITVNGLLAHTDMRRAAVLDRTGTARFYARSGQAAGSFLHEVSSVDDAFVDVDGGEHVDVDVVAMGDVFAALGRPPAFVKIDAEGSEPRILRSVLPYLAEHRPVVLFEVLRTGLGVDNDLHGLDDELRCRGYDVSRIEADGSTTPTGPGYLGAGAASFEDVVLAPR